MFIIKEINIFLFPVIFRVYCADHTYCTLRLPVDTTAETIKFVAADKLKLRANEDLLLVEVKSNGERVVFRDDDISIPTALTLNGRIFVSPKDHLDALVSFYDYFMQNTIVNFFNCYKVTMSLIKPLCFNFNTRPINKTFDNIKNLTQMKVP